MIRSVKDMLGYKIAATDDRVGHLRDMLMDDFAWTVRYLGIDTAFILAVRDVLLAPDVVTGIDDDAKEVAVSITAEQVREAPGLGTDMPLSRQLELDIAKHYNWQPYWLKDPLPYPVGRLATHEAVPDLKRVLESLENSTVRSFRELAGYHIHTTDGELGHAEDFLIDADWVVRYLVIDTRNWLPGRKVLIGPSWIEEITWAEQQVVIDLPRQRIADSPEYDPSRPLTREEEIKLHEHYGKTPYWQRSERAQSG